MKKWEEEQRKKNFKTQIRKAKSSFGQHRNSKINSSLNDSKSLQSKTPTRNLETGFSQRSQLADYFDFEKEDLNSIPLYRLLKMHNLQQYSKQLISRGFGYDISKFNYLNQKDLNILFEEIKVMPGHRSKMMNLIDYINEIYSALSESNSKMMTTPQTLNSSQQQKSKTMTRNATISNYQNKNQTQQLQQQQLKQVSSVKQLAQISQSNSKKNFATTTQISQKIRPQSGKPSQKLQTGITKQGSDGISKQMHPQLRLLKSIEPDFFRDSDDLDDEFSKALENIMNKYQPNQIEKDKYLFQQPSTSTSSIRQLQKENSLGSRNSSHSLQNQCQQQQQLSQPQFQLDNSDLDFQDYQIPNNFAASSSSKSIQQQQQQNLGEQHQKYQSRTTTSSNNQNANSFTSVNSQQSQKKNQPIQKQQPSQKASNEPERIEVQEKSVSQSTSSISSLSITNQSLKELKDKGAQKYQQKQSNQQQLALKTNNNNSNQQQKCPINQQIENKPNAFNKKTKNPVNDPKQQQQKNTYKKVNQLQLDGLIQSQDDITLIPVYNEKNQQELQQIENKILKNLKKHINNNEVSKEHEIKVKDIMNINLEMDKIKNLYISYDSGKLTSTLVNLDIEELCFCLACALFKHIEYSVKINDPNYNPQKNHKKLQSIKEENEDPKNIQEDSKRSTRNGEESWMNCSAKLGNIQKQNSGQQNDDSKLKMNPMEEPTQIQYSQSDLGDLDIEHYLKESTTNMNNKPQLQIGQDNEKSDLQAISEKTCEISGNVGAAQGNQGNNNELNQANNNDEINYNNKQAFEQSRLEIENILKESILIKQQYMQKQLQMEQRQQDESDQNIEQQGESCFQDQEGNEDQDPYEDSQRDEDQDLINNQEETKSDGDVEDQSQMEEIYQQIRMQQQGNEEDLNMNDSELAAEYIRQMELQNESLRNRLNAEPDMEDQDINYSQDKPVDQTSMEFSTVSNCTVVIRDTKNESEELNNRRLFVKTYNEQIDDKLFNAMPSKDVIQNYCKNILITAKMEKEAPIIALVYIERILVKSGFTLTMSNWRKITFTAMIMAGKIWDDESFENENFAIAFPMFSTKQINEMERVFLNFIDYNLYISQKDYAKYYFVLRAFAEKNKKSFPLRPLDLKTIIYLQNNSNRAERKLREIYSLSLNKSY